jgi:hypothetical protein
VNVGDICEALLAKERSLMKSGAGQAFKGMIILEEICEVFISSGVMHRKRNSLFVQLEQVGGAT